MKVFNLEQAIKKIAEQKRQDKKIVLVGGCFDVLHPGHVRFLEEAKKTGDILVVALESDQKVKMLKGLGRPVFLQEERAEMLSALSSVDMVILLPMMVGGKPYSEMVEAIKPEVIAVTDDDPLLKKKKMEAERYGGKLEIVISRLTKYSTTSLIKNGLNF